MLWAPLAVMLGISGCLWLYGHRADGWGALPDELLVPVWLVSGLWAAWMAYTGRPPAFIVSSADPSKWLSRPSALFGLGPWRAVQYGLGALLTMLVGLGLAAEVSMARENVALPDIRLTKNTAASPMAADIEAATWIRSHTSLDSIVMARHLPLVYHYSERKLVWFPPSSNPVILMQGVIRHNVNYVVVIEHKHPYYLPDDDYCFDKLLEKYADAFQVVFQDSNIRIFKVQLHSS
jgi:hypothetical protein